jgi:secreted PhoX family phosphatase
MHDTIATDRRGLLKGGASAAAAFSMAAPFAAIMEAQASAATDGSGAQTAPVASPYGRLAPVKDLATGLPLLQLPKGFSYRSMSWTGDMMSDGQRCAARHDGMAVVQMTGGRTPDTYLIRNHENGAGPLLNVPGGIYDNVSIGADKPAGGCTVLRVRGGQLVDHRAVIGGTIVNCAGGRTLWNSWLTCEETTTNLESVGGKKHGYIFDVPYDPAQISPVPLVDMGRFSHEAIATDPVTGYIYETEDARNQSGFYRFKPTNTSRRYRSLEDGGVLQAAKVVGTDRANLLALAGTRPSDVARVGDSFSIEWVDIANPDADPAPYEETGASNPDIGVRTVSGPFKQAREAGALRMSRGEGIWWDHKSSCMYVVDTSFGYETSGALRAGRGLGSIWAYRPSRSNPDRGTLTLVYAAAARMAGNNPDNITVSPKGGLLTFDDGAAVADEFGVGNRIMGYRNDGLAYIFAKNNAQLSPTDIAKIGKTGQFAEGDYRGAEFCGGTFDWSGRTLYVNIQSPGITYAITGPWGLGNL